jgi:hypothetical protein
MVSADEAAPPSAPQPETYAPMTVDEKIPEIKGEDSRSKLDRLDALSMQTHRQLSIARTQGQSKDVIEKLEKKITAINDQRVATMKKLHIN